MSFSTGGLIETAAAVAITSNLLSRTSKGQRTQAGLRKEHKRGCIGDHCRECKKCFTGSTASRSNFCKECTRIRATSERRRQSKIVLNSKRKMTERGVRTR